MAHTGIGLAGTLAVVGVAWGYLKTDLATAGAHRGRFRITAALATLAILAALAAVAILDFGF